MAVILGIILTLIASLIGSVGTVLVKQSYENLTITSLKAFRKNHRFLLGLSIYIGASLITIIALKFGPVSLLYPIAATSYVWVALFSKVILDEKMNNYKTLGISLILLAVLVLSVWG